MSDGVYSKKIIGPILKAMTEVALAPFQDAKTNGNTTALNEDDHDAHDVLSFFPSLPRIRSRRYYEADSRNTKIQLCTKKIKDILHLLLAYSPYFVLMVWYMHHNVTNKL